MRFEFLERGGPGEYDDSVFFSRFSFILHLAQHFANFRRSLHKCFAANCTFLLATHKAVSSVNWDF